MENTKSLIFNLPLLVILAIILIVGAIGGVAGTVVAFSNPAIRDSLGLQIVQDESGLSLGPKSDVTQKVVLEESSAIIDATEKVSPAVVSITVKTNTLDLFGRPFVSEGQGTGFIITSDGLIVTNKHVVGDQTAKYAVFLADGTEYDAEVLARDPFQDLAVLKIDTKGLPTLELGDSDELKVGQYAIAIGNALGEFQNSVTLGVISAKEREIVAGGEGGTTELLEGLLQTDAAINQGNSGGPLVNLKGQVVGVNTAVAAKGQAEGIGFAIPINAVKNSINQVKNTGKITRPYLGVRYVPITNEVAKQQNLPVEQGAYIVGTSDEPGVVENSPAQKAGIQAGDIITEINGEKIQEQKSLSRLLGKYNVGDSVEITIVRGDETLKKTILLEELK